MMLIDLPHLRVILQRPLNAALKDYMHTGQSTSSCLAFLVLVLLADVQAGLADAADFSSDDTITITADRGWEGQDADIIHFAGNFTLYAPNWSMTGDTAVVYGKLDNPDKVIVKGGPATVSFLRKDDDQPNAADAREKVTGVADVVEYHRATDKLTMRGAANLIRKESTLGSQTIEYDIATDRYSASGEGGIDIQYNPEEN